GFAAACKLERALQPQMHDVPVRAKPDGSAEDTREMEWAAPGDFGERAHLDWLADVGRNVIFEPRQHLFPQGPAHLELRARGMARHQTIDECAGLFVPEQGPVGIVTPALRDQRICGTEKLSVAAGESLDQPSFERRVFRGRESEMAR